VTRRLLRKYGYHENPCKSFYVFPLRVDIDARLPVGNINYVIPTLDKINFSLKGLNELALYPRRVAPLRTAALTT